MAASYVKENRAEDDKLVTQERRVELAREKVRSIRYYEICTPEWFDMAEHVQDLSALAKVETYCPKVDYNWSEQEGKAGEGTLWDQQVAEVAIRVLVEDAKVVACLRLLNDLKKWQYDPIRYQEGLQQAVKLMRCKTTEDIQQKLTVFEESLGYILQRAYNHVEAMQLSDMPLTIEHVGLCMREAKSKNLSTENTKLQETAAMFLLFTVCKHIESFNANELLARVKEQAVLPLIISHVLARLPTLGTDIQQRVVEGLAGLCESEDFQTIWEEFFSDAEKKELLDFDDKVVKPLLQSFPDKRAAYRPCTDWLNRVRRSVK
jgi:hypothetical protein